MAFSGPIEDRLAIRELIDAYNDAVHRRDADDWAATWTEDATWDLLGHVVSGKPAIVETWKGAMATFSYVGFSATPGAIEVDGDKAVARVYVRETLIGEDKSVRRVEGSYDDELAKEDGAWRFQKRIYKILNDSTDQ
jgi:uncharacterized protein (TIGR02246 family)